MLKDFFWRIEGKLINTISEPNTNQIPAQVKIDGFCSTSETISVNSTAIIKLPTGESFNILFSL